MKPSTSFKLEAFEVSVTWPDQATIYLKPNRKTEHITAFMRKREPSQCEGKSFSVFWLLVLDVAPILIGFVYVASTFCFMFALFLATHGKGKCSKAGR